MEIIEQTFSTTEKAPTCCSYCDEEKDFLIIKPTAIAYKGNVEISVNMRKEKPWVCLECFSMEIDAIGHSVDIYEYD